MREGITRNCNYNMSSFKILLYTEYVIISVITSKRMRWGRQVKRIEGVYNKLNLKLHLEILKQRSLWNPWEDNINMNPNETRCEDVNWYHLDQNADQWWTSLSSQVNFRNLQKWRNCRPDEQLLKKDMGSATRKLCCLDPDDSFDVACVRKSDIPHFIRMYT
jgi:hypothetical protein